MHPTDADKQPGLPLPLSVAIVCKNNESTIGRTLESVAGLASQIVAVDSGSADGTIALLESHGAEVIRSEWLGHIRTKQKALELCAQPWILCLDSDESIEPALRESVIAAVRADDPAFAGYEINRKVWWSGVWLNHAWQPEWRLRLVRRGRAHWGGYDPHDALLLSAPSDRAGRIRGDMRHESFHSITHHLEGQIRHARRAAESYLAMGRTGGPLSLIFSPVSAWFKQLVLKQAFRDGWRGWAAASSTACATLMKHIILLELADEAKRERRDNAKR
ncbi:MAG: glycosyltransferase family 2 protein [Phycisphaeraceae bacterium]|nr:glycosyltransferase family 2 protein [Phycisphaeraceae bacterium]MCB9847235.1 glycosyltransferase family 2 protein [Phycisphaeraceae bacterium]